MVIDADVQERLAINDAHYKSRHIVEEVVGDMDKSLPMLCEQLKTRQTKEEMKVCWQQRRSSKVSVWLCEKRKRERKKSQT